MNDGEHRAQGTHACENPRFHGSYRKVERLGNLTVRHAEKVRELEHGTLVLTQPLERLPQSLVPTCGRYEHIRPTAISAKTVPLAEELQLPIPVPARPRA